MKGKIYKHPLFYFLLQSKTWNSQVMLYSYIFRFIWTFIYFTKALQIVLPALQIMWGGLSLVHLSCSSVRVHVCVSEIYICWFKAAAAQKQAYWNSVLLKQNWEKKKFSPFKDGTKYLFSLSAFPDYVMTICQGVYINVHFHV